MGDQPKNDFRLTAKNLLTLSARFQNERMTSAHPSDSNYRVFTFGRRVKVADKSIILV